MKKRKKTVIMTGTHTDITAGDSNLEIIYMPVIRTEKMPVLFEPRSYDWIIFTSRNAVKFMAEHLREISFEHVASIGSKTSAELARVGIKPDFEAEVFSQEGFIDKFPVSPGLSILYPASKNRRKKLEDYLQSRGAIVDAVDLYQPVTHQPSLDYIFEHLTQVDAITFASPSAVHAVMQDRRMTRAVKEILAQKVIAAIGPVTQEALAKENIESISPDTYTNEAMLRLLRKNIEV